jgi:proline racemase
VRQLPPLQPQLRCMSASGANATLMGESTLIAGRVSKQEGRSLRVATANGNICVEGTAEPGEHVVISIRNLPRG